MARHTKEAPSRPNATLHICAIPSSENRSSHRCYSETEGKEHLQVLPQPLAKGIAVHPSKAPPLK